MAGKGSYKQDIIDKVLNPRGYFPDSKKVWVSDANRINGLILQMLREKYPKIPRKGKERDNIEEHWLKTNEHNPKYARTISAYIVVKNILTYAELQLSDRFKESRRIN